MTTIEQNDEDDDDDDNDDDDDDETQIRESLLDKNSLSTKLNLVDSDSFKSKKNKRNKKNKTDNLKKVTFNREEKKINNENDETSKDQNLKSNPTLFFKSTEVIKLKNSKINQGVLQGLNIFHRKHQNGFIDVWWLHDDGGLFKIF